MRILVALGGNAITGPNESISPADQIAAVESAAQQVAHLVAAGHEVILSHGNGPQVGDVLAKNELASGTLDPIPLDWCVAETQGSLGFILLNALTDALREANIDNHPVVVVSRTLVDKDSPAFKNPTKPIGPSVDTETARQREAEGQQFTEVTPGRWRRVVASPEPIEILDAPAVDALLKAGLLVVAGGGGGIPVIRREDGTLEGVEAVIDKDLSSEMLAHQVKADALVIATNVDNVWIDWGKDTAKPVEEVDIATLKQLAADGQFAAGSMGPKVDAVVSFVEDGGPIGIITALDKIGDALQGNAGTVVRG